MRYSLLAAAAAALLSTSAMAQDSIYYQQPQPQAQPQQPARSYAPVATPANSAFPQEVTAHERHGATLSEQDRLFLMQGDRGIGNG